MVVEAEIVDGAQPAIVNFDEVGPALLWRLQREVLAEPDDGPLRDLLDELLGIDISKLQQMSDWGAETLTDAQLDYAASDVLYLHRLKDKLDERLAREGRTDLARAAFDFLPARARLDLAGWPEIDIFAH